MTLLVVMEVTSTVKTEGLGRIRSKLSRDIVFE